MEKILDEADRRILRELQRDSSRTITELADAVGLSHAPCWRRVQRLRADGYIVRETATLDRSKLGYDVEFFIFVKFGPRKRAHIPEFRRWLVEREEVIAAYIILGNYDLMLHVIARNMRDFERFYLENLSGREETADIASMTVMSNLKNEFIPV